MTERTSDTIDTEKVEKEKELRDVNQLLADSRVQVQKVSRQILELKLIKHDACDIVDKMSARSRRLQSDIKILTAEFWQTRNSGQ